MREGGHAASWASSDTSPFDPCSHMSSRQTGGGASRPPLGFLSLAGIGPLARVAFRGPSHHLKQSPIEKTAGRSGRQQLVQNNTASHASLPRQCALRFAFVWDRCVCVCVRAVL